MRCTLATLIAVLAAALVAACGESEAGHTPVTPASDFSSPADGIAFRAPKGATLNTGKGEQVAVLRRGESTLVVSRFSRPGASLPKSEHELENASEALVREYVSRLQKAGTRVRGGTGWVEGANEEGNHATHYDAATVDVIYGDEAKISSHFHIYRYENEYVVDVTAPKDDYKAARAVFFDPVLTSLKITKPQT